MSVICQNTSQSLDTLELAFFPNMKSPVPTPKPQTCPDSCGASDRAEKVSFPEKGKSTQQLPVCSVKQSQQGERGLTAAGNY